MANGNRRPLAPVRKLFAAVLGTCALFVVLFGIGMKSLAIVALGIALIVLAVGLVLVTTIRGGARAWVAGTAHVHTVSEPPASSVFGRCELQVLIDAPGVAGRLVRMRDPRVPVAKWPDVGASLPIMVAIDDPRHIRILWDEVLTHAEAAAARETDMGPLEDDDWDRPDSGYGAAAPVETIETTTADLTDELSGLREPAEPVVVHQTPGGPIVVEGTLVDPPEPAPPLTRRARPDPRLTRAERAAKAEGSGGTATATAPPPAPDVPGQRAGAGPDDVFDFDSQATWADPLFAERRVSRPARGSDDTEVSPPAAEARPARGGAWADAGGRPPSARGSAAVDEPAASGTTGSGEDVEEGWAPAGRDARRAARSDEDLAASSGPASSGGGGPTNGAAASGPPVSRIRRDDDLGDDLGDDRARSAGPSSSAKPGDDPADDQAPPDPDARPSRGDDPVGDQAPPDPDARPSRGDDPADDQAPSDRDASGTRRRDDPAGDDSVSGPSVSRTQVADEDLAASGAAAGPTEPADDEVTSGSGASRIRRDDDLGEDLAASGGTAASRAQSGGDSAAATPEGGRADDSAASASGPLLAEAPTTADADRGTADAVLAGAAVGAGGLAAGVTDDEPSRTSGGKDGDEDVFGDLFTAYPSARPGATGATIHGVGLTFLVRDLPRSVAFYRDMLGFLEIDGGEHNAVLASGDTRMVLREIRDASPVNRRLVHLNLEVGDVMSVYEDLRAKGVRFTYPPRVVNRGAKLELWAAAFRDPDGHGIAITQWRSRETG
ncbi:glyoxalase/bleomycin resistance protein/dioxygenase superfamily protein [Asanoa ferruginea]|uniref:Glyoxalase/bleomycin resistance protein/dioxygenase superfamily protein n=1 Tax=Asanoa ferruginea TaxID=53367 RepID=A0A3D9ZCX1_9ACTN|nr:glyoxalase/bleomycin resistance protein/dioxygenase superfamily protein [Asanoa ferruginea]GIF52290.1 hypothetical protein Afe04nite_68290 [Asanoa ferruginea]